MSKVEAKRVDMQDMPRMSLDKAPLALKVVGQVVKLLSTTGEDSHKLRLITIAISHYVEKVRWTLDIGKIPYTEDGHLAGLHSLYTLDATQQQSSMTPCLVTRDTQQPCITDSTKVLKYLSDKYSQLAFLYPENIKDEVVELEEFLDQNLGVPVRRYAYSYILRDPSLSVKALQVDLPWIERFLLPKILPRLRFRISRMLDVDLKTNSSKEESSQRIEETIEKVNDILSDGRRFLCGDVFTAADLTFAALAYPIVAAAEPEMWECRIPHVSEFPEAYQQTVSRWIETPAIQHAVRMYKEYRFANGQEKVMKANPTPRDNLLIPLVLLVVAIAAVVGVVLRALL